MMLFHDTFIGNKSLKATRDRLSSIGSKHGSSQNRPGRGQSVFSAAAAAFVHLLTRLSQKVMKGAPGSISLFQTNRFRRVFIKNHRYDTKWRFPEGKTIFICPHTGRKLDTDK